MGWFRSSTSSTEDGRRAPSFEERLAAIHPGVPGRCPACDGLGYIDELDIGRRYQIQHCKSCGHRWEYLFDDGGRVVGLTELDGEGRPVARMRVRGPAVLADAETSAPATPVLPPLPPGPGDPVASLPDPDDDDIEPGIHDVEPGDDDIEPGTDDIEPGDDVIDLRDRREPGDPAPEPAPDLMTPAEWLRHSLRR